MTCGDRRQGLSDSHSGPPNVPLHAAPIRRPTPGSEVLWGCSPHWGGGPAPGHQPTGEGGALLEWPNTEVKLMQTVSYNSTHARGHPLRAVGSERPWHCVCTDSRGPRGQTGTGPAGTLGRNGEAPQERAHTGGSPFQGSTLRCRKGPAAGGAQGPPPHCTQALCGASLPFSLFLKPVFMEK